MSEEEPPDSTAALIDSIAEIVPDHLRAAFYRDMMHSHSLNQSDEMLKIMKTIGWHTVITIQVPARIAAQIGTLDRSLRDNAEAQQRIHQLFERVWEELVGRVSAEAIANQLYESLRQQFVKSTIPHTGQALAVVSEQIKGAVAGLEGATPKIVLAHKWAASEGQKAMRQMKAEIAEATAAAHQATAELSSTFQHEYRWGLGVLLALALFLGLLFGLYIDRAGLLPR